MRGRSIECTRSAGLAIERHGDVLVVAFNRQEWLNAFTPRGHREPSTLFSDIAVDDATRAVVLTGRGSACSSGADEHAEHAEQRTANFGGGSRRRNRSPRRQR
ncbi:MAG: hypothetical protein EXR63_00030 [Dehalococcoidia bacterium]|nr:hypothetical protein [Dehalococcoidia bacterium]